MNKVFQRFYSDQFNLKHYVVSRKDFPALEWLESL